MDLKERNSARDIAVIGMAGRFPGARNLEQFWMNLQGGIESISFFSRDEVLATGLVGPEIVDDPKFVKAAGLLDDIESFDAGFFGYSPREAESIDPQQRIFLECCWHALEDSCCDSANVDIVTSVYAGCGMSSYYFHLYRNPDFVAKTGHFQLLIGNDKDYLSTRTSYKLNLKGPSVTVQTACSTSLVAVCLACEGLLHGQCDMALAGGVSIRVPQKTGYYYQPEGIYSPDGHCRAFDAHANGTVFGNGAGVVVLKRMEDAVQSGDRIRAIIRAAAVNNDGSLKAGYTTPSIQGQAEIIAFVQSLAGIDPATISYVETHGTGTSLGDPIEVEALTQSFRAGTAKRGYCAIGSVKPNVGHLDAAAGIAGFIKTVLALEHHAIPPSINCDEPNPRIQFAETPFFVNTRLSHWERGEFPRRAGVSSFGIGGTNAHVILEEAPSLDAHKKRQSMTLLALSAMSRDVLDTVTTNCADFVARNPDIGLGDLACTYHRRRALSHRRIVVCDNTEEAVRALQNPSSLSTGKISPNPVPLVFMFPGQGSQCVNMGAGLYKEEPGFRSQIDGCAEFLKPLLELDLRSVLYPAQGSGKNASELLLQTRYTQPALFVVEYALALLLKDWGISPDAMIGHSVGEYVAACLAGVFSLEDALRIVATRASLTQRAPTGAMLAVPLSESDALRFISNDVCIACLNEENQTVISGPVDAINILEHRLANEGIIAHRLRTSHAFHSSMVDSVVEPLTQAFQGITLRAPSIPFASNVTGSWISESSAQDPKYWAKHLRTTVRFADGIRQVQRDLGDPIWIEVGPGEALTRIVRRQDGIGSKRAFACMPPQQGSQSDSRSLLSVVGALFLLGRTIDLTKRCAKEGSRIISAPLYPFIRERHWVESLGVPVPPVSARSGGRHREDISKWFYVPTWRQSVLPKDVSVRAESRWMVFEDDSGIAPLLIKEIESRGGYVVRVKPANNLGELRPGTLYQLDPAKGGDYESMFRILQHRNLMPHHIVHLWSISTRDGQDEGLKETQDRGFYSLLRIAQALGELSYSDRIHVLVCTSRAFSVTRGETIVAERVTVSAACRIIPQEYPNLCCSVVDVGLSGFGAETPALTAGYLLREASAGESGQIAAYRSGRRWIREFEAATLKRAAHKCELLRMGGVYLITGGLGGIGLALAKYLARRFKAKLILVGRSSLPLRRSWRRWLAGHEEGERNSRIIRALQDIERLGGKVLVIKADVSNYLQMKAGLMAARKRFHAINGVIHAAGVAGGRIIQAGLQGVTESVFSPKVQGVRVLQSLLRDADLDFIALCSSMTSILGGIGQVDYCAANAFLDAFACANNRGRPLYTSINWDTWREVGMAVNTSVPADLKAFRDEQIANGISPDEGVEVFERVLQSRLSNVAVSTTEFRPRIKVVSITEDEARSEEVVSPNGARYPRPDLDHACVEPKNKTEERIAKNLARCSRSD